MLAEQMMRTNTFFFKQCQQTVKHRTLVYKYDIGAFVVLTGSDRSRTNMKNQDPLPCQTDHVIQPPCYLAAGDFLLWERQYSFTSFITTLAHQPPATADNRMHY
jgi:hypothetical protein